MESPFRFAFFASMIRVHRVPAVSSTPKCCNDVVAIEVLLVGRENTFDDVLGFISKNNLLAWAAGPRLTRCMRMSLTKEPSLWSRHCHPKESLGTRSCGLAENTPQVRSGNMLQVERITKQWGLIEIGHNGYEDRSESCLMLDLTTRYYM